MYDYVSAPPGTHLTEVLKRHFAGDIQDIKFTECGSSIRAVVVLADNTEWVRCMMYIQMILVIFLTSMRFRKRSNNMLKVQMI